MPRHASHRRPTSLKHFYFGSAYYPEHWDEATCADDARRMREAGWNCVRLAEFAWDLMEPRESAFDFGFFERVIDEFAAQGIDSILCTPTAAPPRWLSKKHPEILRVDAHGRPLQHGSRQHASHMSPVFREYCQKITRTMAEHFRGNPHVIGWQTDNEFHCHFSEDHSEAARAAFVAFLKDRYHSDIGALNAAWGTAFWAQTYDCFEEIPTPVEDRPTYPNPAHQLDYFRFLSHAVTRFQRDQVEILRSVRADWWITHNGCFDHIDYAGEFARDLDFLGYDSYPFFQLDPAKRGATHAFNLDRTRAWSGNFILLEHQSGPGGQPRYFHDNPEPGEMRRMAYATLARGADSLLFFRWRTCRFGAEEYWCGILDHDNIPRRRYREAAQLGAELKRVGPELLDTSIHLDVAVATSDMEVNDAERTYSLGLPPPNKTATNVHNAFYDQGYAVGCVHPADDLSGIGLYLIPHWPLFDPEWAPALVRYVEQGGTLVIGARTATRDLQNNVAASTPPGVLRELVGAGVEEYGRQNDPGARSLHFCWEGDRVLSEYWYESLIPDAGTEVLVHWQGRHLDGAPAATIRTLGKGRVLYVGTYFTPQLIEALLPELTRRAGVHPLIPDMPEGVECVLRRNETKNLWFLTNHNEATQRIEHPPEGMNLITETTVAGTIELKSNEVAVILGR